VRTVAVLCVARRSVYHGMPDVECYDIGRDVRTFEGGMPVVAHPPCRSWSAFCAHQAKPLPGEQELGPLCVEWLRKCGGILEQPAYSRLFAHCGLPTPGSPRNPNLWTAAVLQCWFGDSRPKNTWLCFFGITPRDVQWPFTLDPEPEGGRRTWQLMNTVQRSATPRAMAEWLVDIARKSSVLGE
jgi:hypothetical protein